MSTEPTPPSGEPTPPAPPPVPPAPLEVAEVKLTKAGALWSSLIVGLLILTILLVFITQNTDSTSFTFLGWHWTLPLGVAILLAAICGSAITVAVGAARIFQLRRAAKKNLKAALKG